MGTGRTPLPILRTIVWAERSRPVISSNLYEAVEFKGVADFWNESDFQGPSAPKFHQFVHLSFQQRLFSLILLSLLIEIKAMPAQLQLAAVAC